VRRDRDRRQPALPPVRLILRLVMKMISRSAGHATDTSRDHEYTGWAQVQRFAASIAAELVEPRFRRRQPRARRTSRRTAAAPEAPCGTG